MKRRLGSVKWEKDHYVIRVTIARKKKSQPIHLPKGVSEEAAWEEAATLTLAARRGELRSVSGATRRDTVFMWFSKWFDQRKAAGIAGVDKERGRVMKWIKPIAKLRMVDVQKKDLEKLVAGLDAAATAHAAAEKRGERPKLDTMLSWKSAVNVWSLVKKGFADAVNAKREEMRCLSEDPAKDVRGPDHGDSKLRTIMSPARFLAFVAAHDVPIAWRRALTLAIYTQARQSELRGVRGRDIHVDELYMELHETLDAEGVADSTKTGQGRRIAIEPALVPLLKAMKVAPNQRAFELPDDRHMARGMRRWLSKLGLDDGDLSRSATRAALTWHDLRGTGCTWRAIRGDNPFEIQAGAGHERFSTTERYIRIAGALKAGFKNVFPKLPPELVGPASGTGLEPDGTRGRRTIGRDRRPRQRVGEVGFEP
ncbi:MAG: tyrosine-type recombinase/integrase, partial [Polyangiaceae bacterium]|nr:tyrosine-type recombinase/integrase [Polyangiaceae bacterium]